MKELEDIKCTFSMMEGERKVTFLSPCSWSGLKPVKPCDRPTQNQVQNLERVRIGLVGNHPTR
jgi:hypothetical protein